VSATWRLKLKILRKFLFNIYQAKNVPSKICILRCTVCDFFDINTWFEENSCHCQKLIFVLISLLQSYFRLIWSLVNDLKVDFSVC
jgi:hypothetical protein